MKPIAPFEHEKKFETDAIVVLEPDSDKFFIKNSDERLEAFGTNVLSPTRGIWGYSSYPNFDTGTVGQLKISPQTNYDCSGCYLSNINGSNVGKVLLPAKTVNKTAHTITEEFIVRNDNLTINAIDVEPCNDHTGWSVADNGGTPYGTEVVFSSDGSKVTITGKTDASGYIIVQKTISSKNLTNYPFIVVDMICDKTCSAYLAFGAVGAFNRWVSKSCTALTANINARMVLPIKAPLDATTTNSNPNSVNAGTNWAAVIYLRMGILYAGNPNTQVTFSFNSVTADVGKRVYIEMNVPDNLNTVDSLSIYSWLGLAYDRWEHAILDPSYGLVGASSASLKFLDSTAASGVFTGIDHRGLIPIGSVGVTKTGENSFSMTYSNDKGNLKRIGIILLLPPSDNGRTTFSQIQLKVVLSYDDIYRLTIPDKLGITVDGVLNYCVKGSNYIDLGTNFGWITTGLKTRDIGTHFSGKFIFSVKSTTALEAQLFYPAEGQALRRFNLYLVGNSLTAVATDGTLIRTYSVGNVSLNVINTFEFEFVNNTFTFNFNGTISTWTPTITVTAATSTTVVRIGGNQTYVNTKLDGNIYYAKFLNLDTGRGFEYIPTIQNMGNTTYEFSNDNAHFTGLQNIEKPLMGWFTDNGVEFYVFDRQLKVLNIREDEDKTSEVVVGVTKGTKVYHGYISYKNKTKDSNSDGVPDVIDAIERMCKRVQEVQEVWLQVSFTPAIATNDFSILLADCEQSYPVSAGTVVKSSGVVQIPLRTENGLSYYDVVGKTLKYKESDDRTKDCKVWDTCGSSDETTWKRVYSIDYVFTGEKVIENGLIRFRDETVSGFVYIKYNNSWVYYASVLPTKNSIYPINEPGATTISSISSDKVVINRTISSGSYVGKVITVTIRKGMYNIQIENDVSVVNLSDYPKCRFYVAPLAVYDSEMYNNNIQINVPMVLNASFFSPTNNWLITNIRTYNNGTSNLKTKYPDVAGWMYLGMSSNVTKPANLLLIPFDCSKIHTDVVNMTGGIIV